MKNPYIVNNLSAYIFDGTDGKKKRICPPIFMSVPYLSDQWPLVFNVLHI
jgi:hypothetical protein